MVEYGHEQGCYDDERNDRGHEAPDAAHPVAHDVNGAALGELLEQARGGQIAREHEENCDAEKAALAPAHVHVVEDDADGADGAQTVERLAVGLGRGRRRGARCRCLPALGTRAGEGEMGLVVGGARATLRHARRRGCWGCRRARFDQGEPAPVVAAGRRPGVGDGCGRHDRLELHRRIRRSRDDPLRRTFVQAARIGVAAVVREVVACHLAFVERAEGCVVKLVAQEGQRGYGNVIHAAVALSFELWVATTV